MGVLDLVSTLFARPESRDLEVTDRHRRLSDAARSDRLTPELLATRGDRTSEPLATYLEADEQPQYVFRGSRLVMADSEDTVTRNHPTRLLVVLVSDDRLLFVLGGRLADDLFEVPLADVVSIHVDEDGPQQYVVVEADRDGDRMTFYADVTLEARDEVADGVAYVRSVS